jgi:hypothetical protein
MEKVPDLAGAANVAKVVCEDRALSAKQKRRRREITERQLEQGRAHYAAVKAAYDDALTDLRGYLDRRLQGEDQRRVEQKLRDADAKMVEFFTWHDSLGPRSRRPGGAGPLSDLLGFVRSNWKDDREETRRAVARLQGQLEQCRLADWDAVGN